MKVQHTDDDQIFASHYDSDALHEMLATQHKITEHTKNMHIKTYVQILLLMILHITRVLLDSQSC